MEVQLLLIRLVVWVVAFVAVLLAVRLFLSVGRIARALERQAGALADLAESVRSLPAVRHYDHVAGRPRPRAA